MNNVKIILGTDQNKLNFQRWEKITILNPEFFRVLGGVLLGAPKLLNLDLDKREVKFLTESTLQLILTSSFCCELLGWSGPVR